MSRRGLSPSRGTGGCSNQGAQDPLRSSQGMGPVEQLASPLQLRTSTSSMEAPTEHISAATSERVLLTQGSLEEIFQQLGRSSQQEEHSEEGEGSIPPLYNRSWSASSSSSSSSSIQSFDSNQDKSQDNWEDDDSIPEAYSRSRSASESSFSYSTEGETGNNSGREMGISDLSRRSIHVKSTEYGEGEFTGCIAGTSQSHGLHKRCRNHRKYKCGSERTSTDEVDSLSSGGFSRSRFETEKGDDSEWKVPVTCDRESRNISAHEWEEDELESIPDLTIRQDSSEDSLISYMDHPHKSWNSHCWGSIESEDADYYTSDDSIPSLEDYPTYRGDRHCRGTMEEKEEESYISDDSMPSLAEVNNNGTLPYSWGEEQRKLDRSTSRMVITSKEWTDILLDSMHMMERWLGESADMEIPIPLRTNGSHGVKDLASSPEDELGEKMFGDKVHNDEDSVFSRIMEHYDVNLGRSHSIREQNDILSSMITLGYLGQQRKQQYRCSNQGRDLNLTSLRSQSHGPRSTISLHTILREDPDRKYAGFDDRWENLGSSKDSERSGQNKRDRSTSPPRLKDPPERSFWQSLQAGQGQDPSDDSPSDSSSESSVGQSNNRGSCKDQSPVRSDSSSSSSDNILKKQERQQDRSTKSHRTGRIEGQEVRTTKGDGSDTRKKSRRVDTRGKGILNRVKSSAKGRPARLPPKRNKTKGSNAQRKEIRANQKRTAPEKQELKKKYRDFEKGEQEFLRKLVPTKEDLKTAMLGGREMLINEFTVNNADVDTDVRVQTQIKEVRDFRAAMELVKDGGVGYMPDKKETNRLRILLENVNSLGPLWKIDKLNGDIIQGLNIDVLGLVELQRDWRLVNPDDRLFAKLRPGVSKKGVTANNVTARPVTRDQVGGTAVVALGRIVDLVDEVGEDTSGLARWCWLRFKGDDGTITYFASGYYPRKAESKAKKTGWYQHKILYESKGDFRNPSVIFQEDLLTQLGEWRTKGYKVILAIDANQNVYDGTLAKALAEPPFLMECALKDVIGERVPNSWHRGKDPISTIFSSPGINVTNAMAYPHYMGIGDHRMFCIEVTSESLFGGVFPTVSKPISRQLNCRIPRTSRKYRELLLAKVEEHGMHRRMDDLFSSLDTPHCQEDITARHETWDRELGMYMANAENNCTIYRECHYEFSPEINLLLQRRNVLRWNKRYFEGRVPHVCRLQRACRSVGLPLPEDTTEEEVKVRLEVVSKELRQLRENAPSMRRNFLQQQLKRAKERGDEEDEKEIQRIIKRESDRRKQQRINRVVKAPKGRSVIKVQLNDPKTTKEEDAEYRTDEVDIVRECNSRLGSRFQLGKRAPMTQDDILRKDFGSISDTPAAARVLSGNYSPHENCDEATKLLLREISIINDLFEGVDPGRAEITMEDFIHYWKKRNEKTSSSYSGRHIGHYKASIEDMSTAVLHCASLNLALRRGIPLSRWSKGVTVLLEKEPGNCYIEKLRAICLMEGDLNLLLKIMFTQDMMRRMKEADVIPVEQIATKGKQAIDGVMQKQLFYDFCNINHYDASLSSTDAANCYDAVNHPVCSLALQCMRVPMQAIRCYLCNLSTMVFYLKTGFGMAKEGYGGSEDNPFMGLTQGSCASPPVWVAVSTVIVRAYREEGHGVEIRTSWSGDTLVISAILYVDDTDLLHQQRPRESREDFIRRVNVATYLWSKLLQATGGNLKPPKCYYYLMLYNFENGEPRLELNASSLDLEPLVIPQHSGPDVPIELKECDEASETLGVFTSPDGSGDGQFDKMMTNIYKWIDNIMASNLQPHEVWHSFFSQAIPQAKYGLVPLMIEPATLEETFLKAMFEVLPKMGVKRNITTDWRWIPTEYQGLGLPNMGLEKLSYSIMFFLRHWGEDSGVGKELKAVYEGSQVEIGLEGNFLTRSFTKYGCLATNTWMSVLWNYLDYYGVQLVITDATIPPPRERDVPLMELITERVDKRLWPSVNRVRKFKKVYFLSQLLNCDGVKVRTDMLTADEVEEGIIMFPREEPTTNDLRSWLTAIKAITSPIYEWSPPLGKVLESNYQKTRYKSEEYPPDCIYRFHGAEKYVDKLVRQNSRRSTRSSEEWVTDSRISTVELPHLPCLLQVQQKGLDEYRLVGEYPQKDMGLSPNDESNYSVKDKLLSLDNETLWNDIDIGDTGNWIRRSLNIGKLILVHDGSYMPDTDPEVCSAALIVFCSDTKQLGYVAIAERTNHHTASNYRGEILGAILGGLVLWAATGDKAIQPTTVIGCDNLGVVNHANDSRRSLPEKQTQADVLRTMRNVFNMLNTPVQYEHIEGHQDDNTQFDDLPLMAQLNVLADKKAKECLLRSMETKRFICSEFPFERTRVFCRGVKITGSIRQDLYKKWGREVARELFVARKILSKEDFDLVNWEAVGAATNKFPTMYRVWITKQVSHFAGHRRMLDRYVEDTLNCCPSCGQEDESLDHLTKCKEDTRSEMFEQSVDELLKYCEDTGMNENLICAFETYLMSRGDVSLSAMVEEEESEIQEYAAEHDRLGWTNFLEGRVSTSLHVLQEGWMREKGKMTKIKTWSGNFSQHLLQITHRQWLCRNARVHLKKMEGRNEDQHREVFEKVKEMMLTDPSNLLPRHQELLLQDFEQLGLGSTSSRVQWLNELDFAIKAKAATESKNTTRNKRLDRHNVDK